jgi:hypothetical protein
MTHTETAAFEVAEQELITAHGIVQELGDDLILFEAQARMANLMLARGSSDDLDKAYAHLSTLISLLLQEPPPEKPGLLPLWLYLACIRVLHARRDPRAAQLINLANVELRVRSDKITDDTLRQGFLNIPEHIAITNLARAFSLPEI